MASTTPNQPAGKPWWESRTIKFNLLALLAAGVEVAAQNLPALQAVASPAVAPWLMLGIPAANLYLRKITTQAIHAGGSGSDDNSTPTATAPAAGG